MDTCRYSSDVTMFLMVCTSVGVSCCGELLGQEGRSSRPHRSLRIQSWYRACDKPINLSTARSGRCARDRSMARSSCSLTVPSGSRTLAKEMPDTFKTITTSRNKQTSLAMRRRRVESLRAEVAWCPVQRRPETPLLWLSWCASHAPWTGERHDG